MDLLVKWSSDYPTGEGLFFRGFFGLLPTIFFIMPKGKLKTFYSQLKDQKNIYLDVLWV